MPLIRTVTALIFIQAVLGGSDWSYDEESGHGPNNWKDECKKNKQSPIDIKSSAKTESRAPLSLKDYDVMPDSSELNNNGHAVKLTNFYRSGPTPQLSGVGLENNYQFAQVHFHWGGNSTRGSEHTVNGEAYPMEMHLVHSRADGSQLAVLGIFFKISSTPHPGVDKLLPYLTKIREVGQTAGPVFPLSDLIPGDLSEVFRYTGSLTTPPCSEIVEWTVLKTPVDITETQMRGFRELLTTKNKPLVNNYRPVQNLNGRTVSTVKTEPNLWVSSRHPSSCPSSSSSSSSSSLSSSLNLTVTLLVISSLYVVLGNKN